MPSRCVVASRRVCALHHASRHLYDRRQSCSCYPEAPMCKDGDGVRLAEGYDGNHDETAMRRPPVGASDRIKQF